MTGIDYDIALIINIIGNCVQSFIHTTKLISNVCHNLGISTITMISVSLKQLNFGSLLWA